MLLISFGKHIKISLWVLVWVLLLIFFKAWESGLIFYATAIIHELSHVLAMNMLNIRTKQICLLPFGLTVESSQVYIKNPQKEFWISFCGPISNLIMFFIAFFAKKYFDLSHEYINIFANANIMMFAFNILPILPLDGGRMLKSYLSEDWGNLSAFNFTVKISKIFLIALTIAGSALLIYCKFNFSLLLLCSFLIFNLVGEKEKHTLLFMREMTFSKEKLHREGILKGKILVASEDTSAIKLVNKLSYNQFCVIHVLNKNNIKIGEINETQLIEKLSHTNGEQKIGDFF